MLVSAHLQIDGVVSTHFTLRLAPQRSPEPLLKRQAQGVQNPNARLRFVQNLIAGPTSACSSLLIPMPTPACVCGVLAVLMRPRGIHVLASMCSCRIASVITPSLGCTPSAANSSVSVSYA